MFKLSIKVPTATLMLDKKLLKAALRKAGQMVASRARSLIGGRSPSSPGSPPASRTGLLKASVKVKAGRGTSISVLDRAVRAGNGGEAYYARFLETGASGGGKKFTRIKLADRVRHRRIKHATQRHMAPRPFLTSALEQMQPEIARTLKNAIGKGVTLEMSS